jgi:Ca2+/Na+ antiporter
VTDEYEHKNCAVRVVNVYATPWRFTGKLGADEGRPTDLAGLEEHYDNYKEQLPRLLPAGKLTGTKLSSATIQVLEPDSGTQSPAKVSEAALSHVRTALYALPSNQVVLTVSMCLPNCLLTDEHQVDVLGVLLEQCIVGKFTVDGRPVDALLKELLVGQTAEKETARSRRDKGRSREGDKEFVYDGRGLPLLPERHQLVFVSRSETMKDKPTLSTIDKILYRSTPPYRPEFVDPRRPKQLNSPPVEQNNGEPYSMLPWRRQPLKVAEGDQRQSSPTELTLGVVTPYVSLFYGQRPYVQASVFLSTVHAVGTVARFRHIWREAYQQVLVFREKKQKATAGLQTRADLELLADNLGNLEFDLTFGVEFPLMRIESFQTDLWKAMDLKKQTKALGDMFDQLGGSLRSEITAIEVREKRRTEHRQHWGSLAAGLLSLIGIPVGLVIAFLGINTVEVPSGDPGSPNAELSMWNAHFATLYLVASAFAVLPALLILLPYLQELALARRDRLALWLGLGVTGLGAVGFAVAMSVNGQASGIWRIIDACGTTASVAVMVLGVALMVLWVISVAKQRRADRRATEETSL